MSTCTGPSCDRPAVLGGLCRSHDRQQRRGGALRPLRLGPALVHLQGVRVRPEVAQALTAEAERLGTELAEVLRGGLEREARRLARRRG